ncbi:hypothetical protein QYE76_044049 [Lolium multiflorum]|uniref:DUF4283 domain-containing protein n=1 Tax=Lolium multiflorum TaxID=4521 RepID=A0AAD8TKC2_LOLMU|nr:hypothetical protein QYE76_044049 [Lolium multiflorum]
MVARVVSTLGGVLSTRVAVVSNPVGALQPVGVVLRAAAWGKEAAVDVMASMEAVDIKRWVSQSNGGRGGAFQPRFRGNSDAVGAAARGPIDADLLHQTVQAVVAAVTAAQKTSEVISAPGSNGVEGVPDPKGVAVNSSAEVQPRNKAAEPQVVQGNVRENVGDGLAKKKKDDKEVCFRCKKPDHFIDDCNTPYCDICESIHHITSACHLLQAPKPTAILHGYANEALMFFEMPCGAFKAKVENPKLVKVSVEGEVLTIPEIIEHMKRIVPSEKFHWEVYHYKDNIYRVKLPSKQEVQRLKNFGSYVCPLKDTVLFFDSWSSVEEPLYLLPEVWVRVDGVPSDMRADYLSLWGIGSLFGKTLDVDMPFTRKNKLLRIKIGCLDRNLIPLDSDVFIRRGFYKLRFEVEPVQMAQEVNMAEANDDKNGDGDPNNGLGNGNGNNDMEMDAKGAGDEEHANNNGQDENSVKNGVEGMQEQCDRVEEVSIGTLKVPLSPLGEVSLDSILAHKNTVSLPILHAQNLSLSDENCADSYADFGAAKSASGLPRVRKQVALGTVLSDDSGRLHAHRCGGAVTSSGGQQLGARPTTAISPSVQPLKSAALGSDVVPPWTNGVQGSAADSCGAVPLVSHAGDKVDVGASGGAGSDVTTQPIAKLLKPCAVPQKIQSHACVDRMDDIGDRANHLAVDKPMMRAAGNVLGRSSVDDTGNSEGCLISEQSGESSIHSEISSTYGTQTATSLSLTYIDHVSLCPAIEEVIAFGGIPKPTFEVRSMMRVDVHVRWEPQEKGMMRTAVSFPQYETKVIEPVGAKKHVKVVGGGV